MTPFSGHTTLATLPLGGRLLVRSRENWRTAVVTHISDEAVTLSVASPKGRNYRLRREADQEIAVSGGLHFLRSDFGDNWSDNFAVYDVRW